MSGPSKISIPPEIQCIIGTLKSELRAGGINELLTLMARLRTPMTGCPWDLEQNFETIAPYTIEEAYEVADAIARNDFPALVDELGDLLFQVVYHAQMAQEQNAFSFSDVVDHILMKMIRRHPHVFGDMEIATADEQTVNWEALKATEREQKTLGTQPGSALDNIPLALPALARAAKLQRRLARVGFDWPNLEGVFAKIKEELSELEDELAAPCNKSRIADELGDVLFALANLARKFEIDPEEALRATNAKVERRFRFVETSLHDKGSSPQHATLEEMDALWNAAKAKEAESG